MNSFIIPGVKLRKLDMCGLKFLGMQYGGKPYLLLHLEKFLSHEEKDVCMNLISYRSGFFISLLQTNFSLIKNRLYHMVCGTCVYIG